MQRRKTKSFRGRDVLVGPRNLKPRNLDRMIVAQSDVNCLIERK
jgi:hypothetical protein